MAITRTPMVDDDGTGTTGTIINSAWKVELYDQIDAAIGGGGGGWVGATTGQIPFPATQAPSTGANVLDDYEESTWTPHIGTAGQGQTYSTQFGCAIKIGRFVFASFEVQLTNKGTISSVSISGFPYTCDQVNNAGGVIAFWDGLATAWVRIGIILSNGSTVATLWGAMGAASSSSNVGASDITNTARFVGSVCYRTNQ